MLASYYELLRTTGYVGVEGMVPCSESSMSMMLNTQASPENLCELAGVSVFRTKSVQNIRRQLEMLAEKANVKVEAIQTVMTGVNGNRRTTVCISPYWMSSSPRRNICSINNCSVRTFPYRH